MIDESLLEKTIQQLSQTVARAAIQEQITLARQSTVETTSGLQKRVLSVGIRTAVSALGLTAIALFALAHSLATPILLLLLLLLALRFQRLHKDNKALFAPESMAKELRQETLKGNVADGVTSASSDSEFRNDSSALIHIRKIHYTHIFHTAAIDERALVELSKSPTIASLVNNGVFYTYPQQVGGGGAVGDSTGSINGGTTYGKGQLTLEPNESLFVNASKTSGGGLAYIYVIEYEFS